MSRKISRVRSATSPSVVNSRLKQRNADSSVWPRYVWTVLLVSLGLIWAATPGRAGPNRSTYIEYGLGNAPGLNATALDTAHQ